MLILHHTGKILPFTINVTVLRVCWPCSKPQASALCFLPFAFVIVVKVSYVIKREKGTKGGKSKTSMYKVFFFWDRAAFEIIRQHTHTRKYLKQTEQSYVTDRRSCVYQLDWKLLKSICNNSHLSSWCNYSLYINLRKKKKIVWKAKIRKSWITRHRPV